MAPSKFYSLMKLGSSMFHIEAFAKYGCKEGPRAAKFHFTSQSTKAMRYHGATTSSSRRVYSTANTQSDVDLNNVMRRQYKFVEDATPEKLLQLTATYWRRLRCAKPRILTCNVDKAIECRVVDSVLATGASCQATTDPGALAEKLLSLKDSQEIIGCYINLDSRDPKLGVYKDAYEALQKSCDAIMVDVSLPSDTQQEEFSQVDQALSLLKPDVIRFMHGTWQYLASICPEHLVYKDPSSNGPDLEKLIRSNLISERHNAVVIDGETCSILMNASDFEGVIFSSTHSILDKIYGFDSMAGGVIAAMLAASPSNPMLGCITSIIGIDYSSEKCKDMSDGPASLAVNFVDKVHRISTSPDDLLNHGSTISFMKRVNISD